MSPQPLRQLSREGGFSKALKVALHSLERPRIAIVAASPARAEFVRELCLRLMSDAGGVVALVGASAARALAQEEHHLLILDASLPAGVRADLKRAARERLATCRVIEVRKWSSEPPA